MSFWALLLGWRGRINRTTYWLTLAAVHAAVFAAAIGFFYLTIALFQASGEDLHKGHAIVSGLGMLAVFVVGALVAFICCLALIAKRLQDIGVDGRFALLLFVVGGAPTFVGALFRGMDFSLMTLALVIIGLWPGQAIANRYGSPPGMPPAPDTAPDPAPAPTSLKAAEQALDMALARRAAIPSSGPAPSFGRRPAQ